MDRFIIMRSFVSVVRQTSFAGAARALGISRALVSRHIADLENQIGVRLLNRTTRSVSFTEAGREYMQFAQRILTEVAEKDAAMVAMRDNAAGELAIVSPKWIGSMDLGDAIASFAATHPKIHVRLELGGMSKRSYNFIESGYDIAFHTKSLRDSSIMVKKITRLPFVLCASPEYLRRHAAPRTPLELTEHDALVHVNDPVWHFTQAGRKLHVKPQRVVFSSNTYLVLQKAATNGMGVTLVPLPSVYREVQSGELQPLLSEYAIPERPLYAAYAPGHQLVRKVRVFLDFIAEWYQQHPLQTKVDNRPPADERRPQGKMIHPSP